MVRRLRSSTSSAAERVVICISLTATRSSRKRRYVSPGRRGTRPRPTDGRGGRSRGCVDSQQIAAGRFRFRSARFHPASVSDRSPVVELRDPLLPVFQVAAPTCDDRSAPHGRRAPVAGAGPLASIAVFTELPVHLAAPRQVTSRMMSKTMPSPISPASILLPSSTIFLIRSAESRARP